MDFDAAPCFTADVVSGGYQGAVRWAQSEQPRSLIEVGQIAMTSSSKAAGTRRFTVSSAPSS
jgi:hypothetical protein